MFLAAYTGLLTVLGAVLGRARWYTVTLGITSLVVESSLAMPQLFLNYTNKSTQGVSASMVVGWALGDAFKLVYFAIREVPILFVLCAAVQLSVDALILMQMALYQPAVTVNVMKPADSLAVVFTPVNGEDVGQPSIP